MKINKLQVMCGVVIGILVNSLILALRYENEKLVRETVLLLEGGMNPFWILLFANILLFLIVPFLFYSILCLIKRRKKNGRKQKRN